jgi:hypothetical protein
MRQANLHLAFVLPAIVLTSCSESPPPQREPSPKAAEAASAEAALDPKYRELATLPEGIEVIHTPNPVRAVEEPQPGRPRTYRWIYQTTVRSKRGTVTIEEFGCFGWHDGRWEFANFTGKVFSRRDFAEWYSCPEGKLLPGQDAVDPSNWTGGDEHLDAGKSLWYFIGVDEAGRRVKGEAIVERVAEVER